MKRLVKTIPALVMFLLIQTSLLACPVCERQQPKILKGITHGSGPDSSWDYVSVWVMIAIAVLTLFFSVKWLIRPGEKNGDHVKYSILKTEQL